MQNQLNKASTALKYVSKTMAPLVSWLIRCGVGYKDFDTNVRRIFFEQATEECKRNHHKVTDSSLSLLAGLNRRDIIFFKENPSIHTTTQAMSISSRVVTLWVQKKWGNIIPFGGAPISFEHLSKEISQDTHPKTVLIELERLGLVEIVNNDVKLLSESFTPTKDTDQCQQLLSAAVTDHLNAGLVNIFDFPNTHLQQALYADGLTEESIKELKSLGERLWKNLSAELLDKAIELSDNDFEKVGANHRFTLGIYEFHKDYSHEE